MAEEKSIFETSESATPEIPPPQAAPQQARSAGNPVPEAPFPDSLEEGGNPILGILKKVGIGIVVLVVVFLLFKVVSGFFTKNNKVVELTYWGLWEDPSSMQGIINDFEKANPNIRITYTKEDIKQYKDRLLTRITNGNGPDIFRFHNTWLPEVSQFMLPLPNSVITKDEFKNSFYPVALSDLSQNGGIYGIPIEMDTLSLFVNTDIFKASSLSIPTTWDDLATTARLLTVKDATGKIQTSGVALGTFDNITHAPDIISLLFAQNGVNLAAFDKSSSQVNDALKYYTQFALGDSNVWDTSLDPSILAFAKGNLAMYFGFSWDVFQIKQINPNLNFQIVDVPHLPGRDQTIASYWAEGISSKTKHQKEAYLFLNYLSKKETEEKLFADVSKTRLFGEPYARKDLADLLKDNQSVFPFVGQADSAQSSFFASDTFDNGLNSQMNGYLGNAIRSILSNTSVDTATKTLTQGVLQVEGQYQIK